MRADATTRPTLPAELLVEGRPCLVVGGGPVAARKVGHLLAARAAVTVIGPRAVPEIRELARDGAIALREREFADADVAGCFLVFAATNRPEVNRRVLDLCRRRGILCSAADGNWRDGDLVTPAVCRSAGVVVTVSTGGRSCRLARLVRDRIAAQIDRIAADATADGERNGGG